MPKTKTEVKNQIEEYQIELPPIDRNQELLIIKKTLNESNNKILAKALIFVYLNQPCSTGELINKLSSHYKVPISRGSGYYAVNSLLHLSMIKQETYSNATLSNNEIHQKIVRKHKDFLVKIPENFRKKYTNVFYNYLTDFGREFIEFCCKILEIKCTKKKEG